MVNDMNCNHGDVTEGPDGKPITFVCPFCDKTPTMFAIRLTKRPGRNDLTICAESPFVEGQAIPEEWAIIAFVLNAVESSTDRPVFVEVQAETYRVLSSTETISHHQKSDGAWERSVYRRIDLEAVNDVDVPESATIWADAEVVDDDQDDDPSEAWKNGASDD